MRVEWQGDHRLLDASGEKQDFESGLTRLGLDPATFLVEVRREPDVPDGRYGVRYNVYVSDLAHPDRETLKLDNGHCENWIVQFAKVRRR